MKFCSKIKLNEQHCKCKMFNSVLDGFLKMENFKRSDQTYNHDWEKSGGKQLTTSVLGSRFPPNQKSLTCTA